MVDKCPAGKVNKFEYVADYFTSLYPVANNCNTNSECGADEISETSCVGSQISATGAEQGRGSTGVEFC